MKKFVTTALASLNKTEKEQQQERIEAFVEDAAIECQQQIATLKTSTIPGLNLRLAREQKNLEKANTNYNNVRFSVASNFENYVENREAAQDRIDNVNEAFQQIQQEISNAETQLAAFEAILVDLTAE